MSSLNPNPGIILEMLNMPAQIDAPVSQFTQLIIQARMEAFFIVSTTFFVLSHFRMHPEIQELLKAFFGESFNVHQVLEMLNVLSNSMNFDWTIFDTPGKFADEFPAPFDRFGSIVRFSTDKVTDPDLPGLRELQASREEIQRAWYYRDTAVQTFYTGEIREYQALKPFGGAKLMREIVEQINCPVRKARTLHLVEESLINLVLRQMCHQFLGTQDYKHYGIMDSIGFAVGRADPYQHRHGDGMSLFMIFVFLTVTFPKLNFCTKSTTIANRQYGKAVGSGAAVRSIKEIPGFSKLFNSWMMISTADDDKDKFLALALLE